jgi:hypothetical protein
MGAEVLKVEQVHEQRSVPSMRLDVVHLKVAYLEDTSCLTGAVRSGRCARKLGSTDDGDTRSDERTTKHRLEALPGRAVATSHRRAAT